jgi:hypothetical protein
MFCLLILVKLKTDEFSKYRSIKQSVAVFKGRYKDLHPAKLIWDNFHYSNIFIYMCKHVNLLIFPNTLRPTCLVLNLKH